MTADRPNATNALDQIESEIREIDQMIYSWSSDRTLRFDPAHVAPKKESPAVSNKPSTRTKKSLGRVFFWFNLIAFSIPLGLLAFQSLAKSLSPKFESIVLAIALMILASGNLLLKTLESSRKKLTSQDKRSFSPRRHEEHDRKKKTKS